jgi:hypothetical protein
VVLTTGAQGLVPIPHPAQCEVWRKKMFEMKKGLAHIGFSVITENYERDSNSLERDAG